jgi:hypothetical protein
VKIALVRYVERTTNSLKPQDTTTMMISVDAPAPFGCLSLLCSHQALREILAEHLPHPLIQSCALVRRSSIRYTLHPRLPGGKGGFGAQLRTAGSRGKRKKHNNDAAKDASGRRIATLKQARQLAEALRDLPEREAAQREEKRAQLQKCVADAEGWIGRRIKFDDEAYLEVSEGLLQGITDALEEAYADEGESDQESNEDTSTSSSEAAGRSPAVAAFAQPRKLAGWDNESDDEDEDVEDEDNEQHNIQDDAKEQSSAQDVEINAKDATMGTKLPEQCDASAETPGATKEKPKSQRKGKGSTRKR